MVDQADAKFPRITKGGVAWLVVFGCLLLGQFPLWRFDNTTEITPDHSGVFALGFALGGVAAVVSVFVMWRTTTHWNTPPTQIRYRRTTATRVKFTILVALLSFLAVAFPFMTGASIIESRLDFPTSKTRTYGDALMMISRAYRTSGGRHSGPHWDIQTMPIWSNMHITQADYDFMLAHRSPNDRGTKADEITSKGYFCAKVTIQQAGRAIRVMHAGQGQLPSGSIVRCPVDSSNVYIAPGGVFMIWQPPSGS